MHVVKTVLLAKESGRETVRAAIRTYSARLWWSSGDWWRFLHTGDSILDDDASDSRATATSVALPPCRRRSGWTPAEPHPALHSRCLATHQTPPFNSGIMPSPSQYTEAFEARSGAVIWVELAHRSKHRHMWIGTVYTRRLRVRRDYCISVCCYCWRIRITWAQSLLYSISIRNAQ